jgi:hypothetical protein
MAIDLTRTRTPTLALLGVALLIAVAAAIMPGSAAGAHGDCALTTTPPSSYYGVATITSGSVDCTTAKNVLRFTIALTMDGQVVDSGERTCHKATTCWSYLIQDDPAGDQLWCTIVSARIGSHALSSVTRCESDGSL